MRPSLKLALAAGDWRLRLGGFRTVCPVSRTTQHSNSTHPLAAPFSPLQLFINLAVPIGSILADPHLIGIVAVHSFAPSFNLRRLLPTLLPTVSHFLIPANSVAWLRKAAYQSCNLISTDSKMRLCLGSINDLNYVCPSPAMRTTSHELLY